MKQAIEVKHLTKRYEGFLLDDISFEIPYGAIVGFIGENGAGKSTTIKSILGVTPVEAGEIDLLGHRVEAGEKEAAYKEQVGVVFDECSLPKELKVKQIHSIMKNIYRTWDQQKFMDYMKRFALPLEKKVKELSKGMKMKLSIAIALSHDSRILILDEATSGLDPVIRNEILDLFREFIEDEQHTVFLSSHITSDIEKIADYIMLIHKGKLLFRENKDELLYNYAIVRCRKEEERLIPPELIAGREENEYSVSVLVRNKRLLEELMAEKKIEGSFILDKASIEDILLYVVKAEGLKGGKEGR